MKLLPKTASSRKKNALSFSASRLAIPLFIAAGVGALTGLVIVGFIRLIDFIEDFLFQDVPAFSGSLWPWLIIVIPVAGGLMIGLISQMNLPGNREQAVSEVLKALAVRGAKIPLRNVLTRAVTAVLAIGSGFSVGREGPAVHIGAGLGANLSGLLRLGEMRRRNFAACGAAAGIAAVFNAPITGMMFALEIILRDFGAKALSTVVVASVAASIVSRAFLGNSPAFLAPAYSLWSPFEIFLYALLGVFSAFVAVAFIMTMDRSDRFFGRLHLPFWIKPALGGLCVGLAGFFLPQILGMGFPFIEKMLQGSVDFTLLLLLIPVKILVTAISIGSGSSGGTFAPALFVGGALGGAFGSVFYGRLPFDMAPPGAYALAGMASVFAGAFHAPVTAILLVFEMTGDYRLILPLMLAAVVSAALAQMLKSESIDTLSLKRQGIQLESVGGVSILSGLKVDDAMSQDFRTVSHKLSAQEVIDQMSRDKEKTFFVVNSKGELTGMLRRNAIQEALLDQDLEAVIAEDLAEPVYETCFSEEPISEAVRLMRLYGLNYLPVMKQDDPRKVAGVVKSDDVFRAYTEAHMRRDELVHRLEQEDSHAEGAAHIRFIVTRRSPVHGKAIKELGLPQGVVLTSLQREKETLVPDGETRLLPKDKVWAIVSKEKKDGFRYWLREKKLRGSAA